MFSLLILCTGNSCRSQMAEGLARSIAGMIAPDHPVRVESAGVEAHGLNPRAVRAMAAIDIDIADHRSNRIDDFAGEHFDLVLTVCDNAREHCPVFPGNVRRLHRPFLDPIDATGSEAEIAAVFAGVRDDLATWLTEVLESALAMKIEEEESE